MAKSPAWTRKEGKNPENEERRFPSEVLLLAHEGDEVEADVLENRKRSEQPDQQVIEGVELLRWK